MQPPHKTLVSCFSAQHKYMRASTQIVIVPLYIIHLIHISSQAFMTALMNTRQQHEQRECCVYVFLPALVCTALFSFIRQMIPKAILTGLANKRDPPRRSNSLSRHRTLAGRSPLSRPPPSTPTLSLGGCAFIFNKRCSLQSGSTTRFRFSQRDRPGEVKVSRHWRATMEGEQQYSAPVQQESHSN